MYAEMEWSNLVNSDLTRANLMWANLRNCDLSSSIIEKTIFVEAYMKNTNIATLDKNRAFLMNAKFE
jgi:uncharacterized protein YjbI with pentapeptide repeats